VAPRSSRPPGLLAGPHSVSLRGRAPRRAGLEQDSPGVKDCSHALETCAQSRSAAPHHLDSKVERYKHRLLQWQKRGRRWMVSRRAVSPKSPGAPVSGWGTGTGRTDGR
jgi:hypothetical protein